MKNESLKLTKKQEQVIKAAITETLLESFVSQDAVVMAQDLTENIVKTMDLNEKLNFLRQKVCQKKKTKPSSKPSVQTAKPKSSSRSSRAVRT